MNDPFGQNRSLANSNIISSWKFVCLNTEIG